VRLPKIYTRSDILSYLSAVMLNRSDVQERTLMESESSISTGADPCDLFQFVLAHACIEPHPFFNIGLGKVVEEEEEEEKEEEEGNGEAGFIYAAAKAKLPYQ
jgi:hypothetical protein